VKQIVLGLPLNMDDSLGPAAQKTIEWSRKLSTQSELPILFVDERPTDIQVPSAVEMKVTTTEPGVKGRDEHQDKKGV